MARVIYNGNLIQPVQQISITKNYSKTGDGNIIGKVFGITIFGTIVAHKGSPRSTGVFWTLSGNPPDEAIAHDSRLAAIVKKQGALRDLFSTEGQQLDIEPLDGSQSLRCNPRINSINFEPGLWIDTCKFTIELEADELYPMEEDSFLEYLQSADESWSLDTDEVGENTDKPRTYRLTHTVNAVGKRFYDDAGNLQMEAWQQAKDYVVSRLGFDSTILLSSGVNNLPLYYGGFNHVRSENIDKNGGAYSVIETWIIASGNYLEDFTISTGDNISDGLKTVTVNGSIQGLEERNSNLQLTVSKWTNALARFNTIEPLLFNRAQNYSGFSLNSIPVNKTTSRNPVAGNINYSYDFNNRLRTFVSGTVSEVISVSKNFEADVFAVIPVLNRAKGSLIQPLGSKQPVEIGLNIELVFGSDYLPSGASVYELMNTYHPRLHEPQRSMIQSIINAASGQQLNNLGNVATVGVVSNQSDSWSFSERRYSYNLSALIE